MSEESKSLNFIEHIIEDDLSNGLDQSKLRFRFPPEPNGYLHIGHTKAIGISFGLGEKYNAPVNLRFDDTNPAKEELEYVDAIKEDVAWLGSFSIFQARRNGLACPSKRTSVISSVFRTASRANCLLACRSLAAAEIRIRKLLVDARGRCSSILSEPALELNLAKPSRISFRCVLPSPDSPGA